MTSTSEALAIALQHHQAGRLPAAEQMYRQILSVDPNQADAVHLLGVIAHQVGKHEIAVEYIGRAIELMGNEAHLHNNLGEAYRALRRLTEAVACYRRALELNPDYPDAHNNLGATFKDLGKLDEAITCHRRALQLKRDFAEAHNNLGNVLKDQGKLDEAVASYRRSLELKPDNAAAHINLGNVLKDQGMVDEAVVCYHRALRLRPNFAEAHNSLGNALSEQRRPDEAIVCYRRALELESDHADAHNNLGRVLKELGDLQGAEDSVRAALRHNARFAPAHFQLAELLGAKLPDNDLAALRRLLEDTKLTGANRFLLHFGLAQVLDARGEYAGAAEQLERGNALQLSERRRSGQVYDPKEHELFVSRMIKACTEDFFERVRGSGLESRLPVFVFGLPRSGTTLIEQILASHPSVYGAGELPLGQQTFRTVSRILGLTESSVDCLPHLHAVAIRQLAEQHDARLRALTCKPAEKIVDKLPDNYLYLGLLAALFPQAVFIHCRRDARDVAVSCWMTHFVKILWANDRQHIASRFQQYQRIMEHWRKVLPVPLLEVDYEDTVANPEGVARKLVTSCGLTWEPACLEFHKAKRPIRTASVVQARRAVFRTSVGRWKHYEHALSTLFARLARQEPTRGVGGQAHPASQSKAFTAT
jgi:tetratricopeptide (TPR) repeat protein